MSTLVKDYFKGLFHLFFPHVCASCSSVMAKDEKVLCFVCENSLPETKFHTIPENPIEKKILGTSADRKCSIVFVFLKKGRKLSI